MIAADLPAEDLVTLAKSLLTTRQYRAWYLRHFTTLTVYGITAALQEEGFVGYHDRPISFKTIESDLRRAERILDAEVSQREDELDKGRVFGIVLARGHSNVTRDDKTLKLADKHLGYGIQIQQKMRAA